MADEKTTPAGTSEPAGNGQGPAVALQTVYIKDLSFESPKGPFLPAQPQDPKMSMNLSTMSSQVGQDAHEVVLSVTLEAKSGDAAVYLAEVKQAGVFVVRGFSPEETKRILGSFDHVPNSPAGHFDDFSSAHEGGAHFLMCDGAVRFVSENIDLGLYQGAATIRGMEALDEF